MITNTSITFSGKSLPTDIGALFLIGFWVIGFDGITFSDDVYYILAGKSFWEGTMEVNSYHFSSRWGAYVPSGFLGFIFGLNPHIISGFSLFCYLITLWATLNLIIENLQKWLFVVWFCTQVYFLHFITKVYPDAPLVFWATFVPIFATYRKNKPILAGAGLVLALFAGFLTKETIIFLAPFPFILLFLDKKYGSIHWPFYLSILITGILLSFCYLAYFWVEFGDPFYRVHSINAGHYISEFTYADKGIGAIVKRLTILPFQTFVERAYWPWIVFALPGIYHGFKNKNSPSFEFSIAFLCLLFGFWFMSSTIEFYNPIYLNPRHLIIMVPIMSLLVAFGWNSWFNSKKWKTYLTILNVIGILISVFNVDFKQSLFLSLFLFLIWLSKRKLQFALLTIILLAPALYSICYQKELKQYQSLKKELSEITDSAEIETPILVNNFIDFSKEILLPNENEAQAKLFGIENIELIEKVNPKRLKILIYQYYKHAYPREEADVKNLENWLTAQSYVLIDEKVNQQFWYREYEKK